MRILLGIFEGGGTLFSRSFSVGVGLVTDSLDSQLVIPGIVYVMTTFYKRSELAFRIGVFLSLGPGLSGAFGGLLAAGLLKHDYAGLVSWQRIFVLEVSSRISSLAPERLTFPVLRRITLTSICRTGNPHRQRRCRHLLHASRRTGQDALVERGGSRTRRSASRDRTPRPDEREDYRQGRPQGYGEPVHLGLHTRLRFHQCELAV